MNVRHALISSTIAISCLAAAAYADAAKADPANPYHPQPAASTETATHGHDTYCRTPILGTCQGLDIYAGVGQGNKIGLEAREGRHFVAPKPVKEPCEPKGGETPTGTGDGGGLAGKAKA